MPSDIRLDAYQFDKTCRKPRQYHPMRINRFNSRRSAQSISLHLQHQKSPAVIRHMHVRSIIAVLSIFVGEHRTQDCSLSSPFSFLRSPAVVSRRSKAHLVLGTFVSVGRTRTLLFALFMKKKKKRKEEKKIQTLKIF